MPMLKDTSIAVLNFLIHTNGDISDNPDSECYVLMRVLTGIMTKVQPLASEHEISRRTKVCRIAKYYFFGKSCYFLKLRQSLFFLRACKTITQSFQSNPFALFYNTDIE